MVGVGGLIGGGGGVCVCVCVCKTNLVKCVGFSFGLVFCVLYQGQALTKIAPINLL